MKDARLPATLGHDLLKQKRDHSCPLGALTSLRIPALPNITSNSGRNSPLVELVFIYPLRRCVKHCCCSDILMVPPDLFSEALEIFQGLEILSIGKNYIESTGIGCRDFLGASVY